MAEYLPLPRTWVRHQKWEGPRQKYRDILLSGRNPAPGTKEYLKRALLAAGWDIETISKKAMDRSKSRVVDLKDVYGVDRDRDIEDLCAKLNRDGFKCQTVDHSDGVLNSRHHILWDSYTITPWWLSVEHVGATLIITGENLRRLESTTAAFLHDIWSSVGAPPEHRPPSFARINLMSLMTSDSVNRFCEETGKSLDLLILHGGVIDEDSTYQNLGFVSAIRDKFDGLTVFEFQAISPAHMKVIDKASRRMGFQDILGAL